MLDMQHGIENLCSQDLQRTIFLFLGQPRVQLSPSPSRLRHFGCPKPKNATTISNSKRTRSAKIFNCYNSYLYDFEQHTFYRFDTELYLQGVTANIDGFNGKVLVAQYDTMRVDQVKKVLRSDIVL
jgi:hypothetical protein